MASCITALKQIVQELTPEDILQERRRKTAIRVRRCRERKKMLKLKEEAYKKSTEVIPTSQKRKKEEPMLPILKNEYNSLNEVIIVKEKDIKPEDIHFINIKEDAQDSNSDSLMSDEVELPNWPILNTYFRESTIVNDQVMAICTLCERDNSEKVTYRASLRSGTNLKTHLKRVHGIEVCNVRKRLKGNLDNTLSPNKIPKEFTSTTLDQDALNQLIAEYVIESFSPYSSIECLAFKNLINSLNSRLYLCDVQTLEKIITDEYNVMIMKLCEIFSEIEAVSLTVNVRKINERCYVAITGHWIDPNLFIKKAAILSFHTIHSQLNYNEIEEIIRIVLGKYEIADKTVGITADNCNHFSELFKLFHNESNSDVEIKSCKLEIVNETLNSEGSLIPLPPRFQCVAQSLDSISSKYLKELEKMEDPDVFKVLLDGAYARCKELWYRQNMNDEKRQIIEDELGETLKIPTEMKWDTLVESFECILKHKDRLEELADRLDVNRFSQCELEFIEEFCRVMEPLRIALITVQSKDATYLGVLYPLVFGLKKKFKKFSETIRLYYCNDLIKSIEEQLEENFHYLETNTDIMYATLLHPASKRLPQDEYLRIKATHLPKLRELALPLSYDKTKKRLSPVPVNSNNSSVWDILFDKDDDQFNTSNADDVTEWINHSTENTELEVLNKYPKARELFIRYNTPMISSTTVKQLFKKATSILTCRESELEENDFEQNVLLFMNKSLMA